VQITLVAADSYAHFSGRDRDAARRAKDYPRWRPFVEMIHARPAYGRAATERANRRPYPRRLHVPPPVSPICEQLGAGETAPSGNQSNRTGGATMTHAHIRYPVIAVHRQAFSAAARLSRDAQVNGDRGKKRWLLTPRAALPPWITENTGAPLCAGR